MLAALLGLSAAGIRLRPRAMLLQPLPVAPGDTLTVAFSATRDSLYKVIPGLRVVIVRQGSGFIIFRVWRRGHPILVDSVFTASDSARLDLRNVTSACDSLTVALRVRGDTSVTPYCP